MAITSSGYLAYKLLAYLVLTKIGEAWDSSEQVLTGFYIYLPK